MLLKFHASCSLNEARQFKINLLCLSLYDILVASNSLSNTVSTSDLAVNLTCMLYILGSFNLTFRGPCFVIYSYNASQRDTQFLKFI